MANFHTHLSIALATSTSLATAGLMVGAFGFFEMITLAIIGMIGGLLPDIDLDNAKISKLAFTIASLFGASFLLFLMVGFRQTPSEVNHSSAIFARSLEPADMVIVWGVAVLVLKFVVFGLFSKFTRHRGMVHSVPYMAVLSLLFVLMSYHFLRLSGTLSWLFGGFLFFGTLVHLILDEIYSVNIYGLKIKKSFGTAFKFFERKKPMQYALLYVILGGLWWLAPAKSALLRLVLSFLTVV